MNNDRKEAKISLIYESGKVKPFDGRNKHEGVKYVLLEDGWQRLAISLHDGQVSIIKQFDAKERLGRFHPMEITAANDFDGAAATAQLVRKDPDLRLHLNEYGEYIPALGQLLTIWNNLDDVNKALRYAGGDPVRGGVWSSTEQGLRSIWIMYFPYGRANYICSGTYYLRTVKTWRAEP